MNYRCYFCLFRSFEKLLESHPLKETQKDRMVKDFLQIIAAMDMEQRAPDITRYLQQQIKLMLKTDDPYIKEKMLNNQLMLKHYTDFERRVNNSPDRFDTALRLAIAGNIIDYAANPEFDVMKTIEYVLSEDFAIDHSRSLQQDIANAGTVLYLGDNTGEIVINKLLINTIGHKNLYSAVRGKPVLNDATIEDAVFVGIDKHANIISNGYDAPSTLLDKVSVEFLEIWSKADIVISKGQGNLEGLINHKDKPVYFLFMVKCDLIGAMVGAKKGDFVVIKNTLMN